MRDVLLTPMQKFVKDDMNSDVLVRKIDLKLWREAFICFWPSTATHSISTWVSIFISIFSI